jgi:Flp pilus assembly pilin Flp
MLVSCEVADTVLEFVDNNTHISTLVKNVGHEYTLIAVLIVLAGVAGMKTVGSGIASAFNSAATKLSGPLG